MIENHIRILAEAYDAGAEEEYQRLAESGRKLLEFERVCDAVESRIKANDVIVDIGSGPGRYAEYFLDKGYSLGCVDLSARSLKLFSDRISDRHTEKLIFNKVSCATQLHWIDDDTADALLLMGPMYHLTTSEKRLKVLRQCQRILKPDGHLFVMYMSPHPVFSTEPWLQNNMLPHPNGIVTYTKFKERIVPQFRCTAVQASEEAAPYFESTQRVEIFDSESNNASDSAPQYLMIYKNSKRVNQTS